MAVNVKQVQHWMSEGFTKYADTLSEKRYIGVPTITPDENGDLIRKHGGQYIRLLDQKTDWDGDLNELWKDLSKLEEKGFPVLDLVDLMFACTKGGNYSIWSSLASIGLDKSSIEDLRINCEKVAKTIFLLNDSAVPGPLAFLPEFKPELTQEKLSELKLDFYIMPTMLLEFAELLKQYPPESLVSGDGQMEHFELRVFYLLLREYGGSQTTLSRLLSSMRKVREIISPDEAYVRDIEVEMDDAGNVVDDTLSHGAIQKRLHRNMYPEFNDVLLPNYVRGYVVNVRQGLKPNGPTFLTVLPQMIKRKQ